MTLIGQTDILMQPTYKARFDFAKEWGFVYDAARDAWVNGSIVIKDSLLRDAPIPKIGASW